MVGASALASGRVRSDPACQSYTLNFGCLNIRSVDAATVAVRSRLLTGGGRFAGVTFAGKLLDRRLRARMALAGGDRGRLFRDDVIRIRQGLGITQRGRRRFQHAVVRIVAQRAEALFDLMIGNVE